MGYKNHPLDIKAAKDKEIFKEQGRCYLSLNKPCSAISEAIIVDPGRF